MFFILKIFFKKLLKGEFAMLEYLRENMESIKQRLEELRVSL